MSPVTRVLVLTVAAVGFLFDTYELLMFPVIGASALGELLKVPVDSDAVRLWSGRISGRGHLPRHRAGGSSNL